MFMTEVERKLRKSEVSIEEQPKDKRRKKIIEC